MDYAIRQLANRIIGEINAAGLPMEVNRLVLHDITRVVDAEADKIVQLQETELLKQQEKIESSEESDSMEECEE